MQRVLSLGGVFFRAREPDTLRRWYAEILGVDMPRGFWMSEGGPTVLEPFCQDTDYFDRPEQSFMLNFRVADLDAFVAQLKSAGLDVVEKAEWNSDYGRYARVHDPEGNPIELWEPGPSAPKAIRG